MTIQPSPFDSLPIPPEFRRQVEPLVPRPPSANRSPSPSAGEPLKFTPPPPAKSAPAPTEPVKFTTGKAADVCERFLLGEQAALLLAPDLTLKRYIDILTEKNMLPDATRVLAFGLPKRDAVWWACLCLRDALGANPAPKLKGALEAAEKWSKNPIEEHRRPGLKAAEAAGFGTPAGLTAMAAFWSGGSLTPPDAPVVPPAEHMTAEAVAGAVLLAAAGALPDDVPKRQRRFLALGLGVACGK